VPLGANALFSRKHIAISLVVLRVKLHLPLHVGQLLPLLQHDLIVALELHFVEKQLRIHSAHFGALRKGNRRGFRKSRLPLQLLEFLLFSIDRYLPLLLCFGRTLQTRLAIDPVPSNGVLPRRRQSRKPRMRLVTLRSQAEEAWTAA
jgi:hypothetical protein